MLPGIGQFLVQTAGTSIVMAFPLKEAVELGNTMAAASAWAASLKLPVLSPWADNHFQAATLTPGCVAWVPYGHCTYLVAGVEKPAVTVAAPYFSANLIKEYPLLYTLVKYNLEYIKERSSREPYKSLGTSMMDWLKGNLTAEQLTKLGGELVTVSDAAASSAPRPPAALEDEKDKDNQNQAKAKAAAAAAAGDIE
jgi:hypothetical protein